MNQRHRQYGGIVTWAAEQGYGADRPPRRTKPVSDEDAAHGEVEPEMVSRAKQQLASQIGCDVTSAAHYLAELSEQTHSSIMSVAEELSTENFWNNVLSKATAEEAKPAGSDVARRPSGTRPAEDGLLHAMLLRPVTGANGRITDFLIEVITDVLPVPDHPPGTDLTGMSLSDAAPQSVEYGLFDEYVHVFETGRQLRRGPIMFHSNNQGTQDQLQMIVQATRFDDRVLVTWHVRTDGERLAEQLEQAQRLAELGWAEWDLCTNEIDWSPRMYEIFDRDRKLGPVLPSELPDIVLAADLPVLEEGLRKIYGRSTPFDVEFRIRRSDGIAHIRLRGEPVLDELGRVLAVRMVTLDLTQLRRGERALAAARDQLSRQRQTALAEQHVTQKLREAILPLSVGAAELPGLSYSVRYLSAEAGACIGGDWYSADVLPDGRVLLAIGDVAGHGLGATALMAQMRSGLAGLSYTGAPAGQLVTWLNELVCHAAPQSTATAVLGHYQPSKQQLRWSNAGHLPPVLVRDGKAELLHSEQGTLLGVEGQRFPVTTTRLHPGDLLLFYTDGLVERRDRDIGEGITALCEAAAGCAGDDPDHDIAWVLNTLSLENAEDDACLLAVRVR